MNVETWMRIKRDDKPWTRTMKVFFIFREMCREGLKIKGVQWLLKISDLSLGEIFASVPEDDYDH